jgi:thioredoxin-related protein
MGKLSLRPQAVQRHALGSIATVLAVLMICWSATGSAITNDPYNFDDLPLENLLEHPPWFKQSFLALDEDLQEAIDNGKQGIAVYFGQKRCAYCKMLIDVNFGTPDIERYTREHFDVIAIDIWSPEEVTTPSGETMTQRDYALSLNTNFTPSLVFYDADGEIALRLRGYYPPYQFRAALEYVAGGHYKREGFPIYMARGDQTLRFEAEDMVEQPFFSMPPYNLDRSRFPADLPLVVFFEQGNCHACDILHTQPLQRQVIRDLFERFESVQLNMWANTPVVKPDGERSTARQWARELGIFYAPSIVFFDEHGDEIIRVDSVVGLFRLRNVLNYVVTRGYLSEPNFLRWSARTRRIVDDAPTTAQEQNDDR